MTDFELDRLVKLEGTDYDRRRKLSTNDVARIQRAYKNGKSMFDLAVAYGVSYGTIHYHVDKDYRENHNKKRKLYAPSFFDATAQRISRVAHKRAILANRI